MLRNFPPLTKGRVRVGCIGDRSGWGLSNGEQTMQKINIYDTTLRDGSQMEGISFSVEDKVKIARRLDAFGMDYIEGGWPGAAPKDTEFFDRMKSVPLVHSRLAAFGSTRKAFTACADDALLARLVAADTPVVTIVGKSWDYHVTHALRVPLDENLLMIGDTVAYLKAQGPRGGFRPRTLL